MAIRPIGQLFCGSLLGLAASASSTPVIAHDGIINDSPVTQVEAPRLAGASSEARIILAAQKGGVASVNAGNWLAGKSRGASQRSGGTPTVSGHQLGTGHSLGNMFRGAVRYTGKR